MNRPDRGTVALGYTAEQQLVFCDLTDRDIELIAALRDRIDRVDPMPAQALIDGDRLSDLRDQVRIPQLGAFVKELLSSDMQTDDDTDRHADNS